ncbi:MAG: hypothetical protein JW881_12475 [Spirochaetales bacterium]|nr:hypothetical protein [Spirochaetales bacterium]
MPLLPIDLQTMFSHLNQVGKEQAIQKDVSPLHQSLQGSEIAKETIDKDATVNETHDIGDGVEKVNEEENRKENRNRNRKREKEKEALKKEQRKMFRESHLGHHIDIIG